MPYAALNAALVVIVVGLILAVHIYAIVHAVRHGRGGMALLLLLWPGLAWFWIPLHRHDEVTPPAA